MRSESWMAAADEIGISHGATKDWARRRGIYLKSPSKTYLNRRLSSSTDISKARRSSKAHRRQLILRSEQIGMRRKVFLLTLPCPGGCKRGLNEVGDKCIHCDSDGSAFGAYLVRYPDELEENDMDKQNLGFYD